MSPRTHLDLRQGMNVERLAWLLEGALAVCLVRGTIAFLLASASTAMARKLSSEARHLVWLGVIASFLLIPLAWLALPALQVGGWIRLEAAAVHPIAAAPLLGRREYLLLAERVREYALRIRQPMPLLHVLRSALVPAWLAGVLFLTGRLLGGLRKLQGVVAAAAMDSRLLKLARELAGRPQRGELRVLRSPLCRVPFTFGLRRPRILLPTDTSSWPVRRLRSALAHELAHIRRRDVLTQSLAYGLCLLFWFVPPLWLAYAALRRESETCCDRQVLERGFRAPEYARDLLQLARSSEGRILLPSISGAVSGKSFLPERIRNLMRWQPGRPQLGAWGALRVLALCLCCLAPLVAVTFATKPSPDRPDHVNSQTGSKGTLSSFYAPEGGNR